MFEDTATTGNYCSTEIMCTSNDDCETWQTCDSLGTGGCKDIRCDPEDDGYLTCDTLVCITHEGGTEKGYCAKCDNMTGSGRECPKVSDPFKWWTCYPNGMCQAEEKQGLSGAGVAGVSIGTLFAFLLLVGIVVHCFRTDNKTYDHLTEAKD